MYEEDRYWLGPASWSQSKLKWLPFNRLFNYAAYKHDIGYGIGGNIENKRHIDRTFACDMIQACVSNATWNPFAYFFAFFYNFMVVVFGIIYFNWRGKDL